MILVVLLPLLLFLISCYPVVSFEFRPHWFTIVYCCRINGRIMIFNLLDLFICQYSMRLFTTIFSVLCFLLLWNQQRFLRWWLINPFARIYFIKHLIIMVWISSLSYDLRWWNLFYLVRYFRTLWIDLLFFRRLKGLDFTFFIFCFRFLSTL